MLGLNLVYALRAGRMGAGFNRLVAEYVPS
jgi:hypothetical protein